MKKLLKIICIVAIVALIGVIAFKIWSAQIVKDAIALEEADIDISNVPDGTYEGHSELGPVSVDVEVTVYSGKMTDIEIVNHQNGMGQPANSIVDKMVESNTYDVDVVSGATVSSEVIINAVNNALQHGKS